MFQPTLCFKLTYASDNVVKSQVSINSIYSIAFIVLQVYRISLHTFYYNIKVKKTIHAQRELLLLISILIIMIHMIIILEIVIKTIIIIMITIIRRIKKISYNLTKFLHYLTNTFTFYKNGSLSFPKKKYF